MIIPLRLLVSSTIVLLSTTAVTARGQRDGSLHNLIARQASTTSTPAPNSTPTTVVAAPASTAAPAPVVVAAPAATTTAPAAVVTVASPVATTTAPVAAAAAPTSTGPVLGSLPVSPLSDLLTIGTATTSEATSSLPSTYAAGATPPVRGAPVLPSIVNLNPQNYPALDKQPPVNTSQVLQWISEINFAGIPKIPVNGLNGCQNTTVNAGAIASANSAGNCWWTCGGCTRATDLTFCPTKNTWGLSYDDGPSPYTPKLLTFLNANNIKSTFFIVGSRAISRPQMLQTEYMEGHQLSVHTWAHPPLTTMTNEQIVAELGWTKQVIKDITGVTPNTMRPPYGDIDDRVRYISLQMGLTPIIWTSAAGNTFDTRDWQIGAGVVNATSVYNNFERFLGAAVSTLPNGFVVLAHDLYQQSVELAVNYILPTVLNAKILNLQPIITCLGQDLSEAYIETANTSLVDQASTTLVGASGTGFVNGVSLTAVTAPYVPPSTTAPVGSTPTSVSAGSTTATVKSGVGRRVVDRLGATVLLLVSAYLSFVV